MATTISGTNGVSQVQDGIVTQGKLAAASVTDGKLDLTANSAEVKEALNASGTAPIYACRAWVNFDGTGTVAIRASGNVSSITDNGTGDYTVNFSTAMEDADYAMALESASGGGSIQSISSKNVDKARFLTSNQNASKVNRDGITLAIFR